MSTVERMQRRLDRARRKIERLEALIEDRTRELYLANQALEAHAAELEGLVAERTAHLQEALAEAEELSWAKTDFLARTSHELRTPLHGVLGMLDLVSRTELDDRQAHQIRTAIGSGRHLMRVIGDILDFSKLQSGPFSIESLPLRPDALCAEVVETHRVLASRKGLRLDYEGPVDPSPVLLGDPTRVRQVLVNLIGNAVKFTTEGGVTVRCRPVCVHDDAVTFSIDVCDTGIGISEEAQQHLFQPFVQGESSTSRRFGGTGLGLAISKELVERMGGRIGVHSVEGEGSTFTVELSLPHALEEALEDTTTLEGIPAGARVLVVDDQEVNRQIAAGLLEELGCVPLLATDGEEGVGLALGSPPDLVLMDCHMPVLDGYQAAALLRQAGFDRPIVAMTADISAENGDRCIEAGMDELLGKPYTLAGLARLCGRLLGDVEPRSDEGGETGRSRQREPESDAVEAGPPAGIDRGALLAAVGGNTALADLLVESFLADLPGLVAAVEEQVELQSADGVAARAHALKGAAGSVRAAPLYEAARALESAARDGEDWTVVSREVRRKAQELLRSAAA